MPQSRAAGETYAEYTELETLTCASCGVLFAIPEHMAHKRRETGAVFFCPSGDRLSFSGRLHLLERKLDRERQRSGRLAAERDQIEARLRAHTGAPWTGRRRLADGLRARWRRVFGRRAAQPAD
jgi:hypothetical protein